MLGKHPNVCTSFDLWGRFNTEQSLENWLNTTKLLESVLLPEEKIGCEVLLITPSLKIYLDEPDNKLSKILDELLENPKYIVTLQEYVPNSKEQIDTLIPNKD